MKLLVATEFPPNSTGGGAAIVRQMLRNWPVDQLYWWSCFPDRDRHFGQRFAGHGWAGIPARLYPNIKWRKLRSALMEGVWVPWATHHLRRTIAAFNPDRLWIIPHNWSIPPLHAAATASNRPRHVSVHDYVDVHDNPARFGEKRCARFAGMVDRTFAQASTADAVSAPMAEDLERRTGRAADAVIRYGVEPEELREIERLEATKPGNEVRIAYAGSILVAREFALFVAALRRIKMPEGRSLRLHLFGGNPFVNQPWFDPSWMVARGNLAERDLHNELRQCHWGFSPMALTDQDPRYNRFSFPTKFIAYVAAGLPVITLGHPESSVIKLAGHYDVGLCTSSGDPEILAGQLATALSVPHPRERYRDEIVRCARLEFDAERTRQKLYACLRKTSPPQPAAAGLENR